MPLSYHRNPRIRQVISSIVSTNISPSSISQHLIVLVILTGLSYTRTHQYGQKPDTPTATSTSRARHGCGRLPATVAHLCCESLSCLFSISSITTSFSTSSGYGDWSHFRQSFHDGADVSIKNNLLERLQLRLDCSSTRTSPVQLHNLLLHHMKLLRALCLLQWLQSPPDSLRGFTARMQT